ncbi:hypothetical protein F5876DRAFT_64259 [Lentinula aff. lateritia]|uniref:Uncharacterized protein n=1 Tax=Lentinula aff. lateritia TaxID=2804960 RepID=A0ACC1U5N0_9AGAR|nr:hypothetical protein F5876DRAFT_64259 [Lentinula aff. lateritia]
MRQWLQTQSELDAEPSLFPNLQLLFYADVVLPVKLLKLSPRLQIFHGSELFPYRDLRDDPHCYVPFSSLTELNIDYMEDMIGDFLCKMPLLKKFTLGCFNASGPGHDDLELRYPLKRVVSWKLQSWIGYWQKMLLDFCSLILQYPTSLFLWITHGPRVKGSCWTGMVSLGTKVSQNLSGKSLCARFSDKIVVLEKQYDDFRLELVSKQMLLPFLDGTAPLRSKTAHLSIQIQPYCVSDWISFIKYEGSDKLEELIRIFSVPTPRNSSRTKWFSEHTGTAIFQDIPSPDLYPYFRRILNWTPTEELSEFEFSSNFHPRLDGMPGSVMQTRDYKASEHHSLLFGFVFLWYQLISRAEFDIQSFIGHYIPKEVRYGTSRKCDVRGVDGPEFDFFTVLGTD